MKNVDYNFPPKFRRKIKIIFIKLFFFSLSLSLFFFFTSPSLLLFLHFSLLTSPSLSLASSSSPPPPLTLSLFPLSPPYIPTSKQGLRAEEREMQSLVLNQNSIVESVQKTYHECTEKRWLCSDWRMAQCAQNDDMMTLCRERRLYERLRKKN